MHQAEEALRILSFGIWHRSLHAPIITAYLPVHMQYHLWSYIFSRVTMPGYITPNTLTRNVACSTQIRIFERTQLYSFSAGVSFFLDFRFLH